jgi:hypothetical protein
VFFENAVWPGIESHRERPFTVALRSLFIFSRWEILSGQDVRDYERSFRFPMTLPTEDTVTDLTKGVYRRLYSGFIKGQRINKLSLQAEAWFWRVMATADDFGNADADPGLCFAATVGRRVGITLEDVAGWLVELGESGLIQMYADESGDKYLHINGFEELQPAGRNGKRVCRFPRPDESRLIQVNPDFFNAATSPHSHSHSDSHSDTDKRQQRAKRTPGVQGSRLPEDFSVTPELREWARENAPRVDLETTLAEFHDYWKGVPGAKGRKLDWPATFRNRLRELEGRKNGSGLRAVPEHPNAHRPGKMVL